MSNNVLVIAPHADDEVLGVGCTIQQHILRGDSVSIIVVSDRDGLVDKQRQQAENVRQILGYNKLYCLGLHDGHLHESMRDVIDLIEPIYLDVKPTTVYTCHEGDVNLDHQIVYTASTIVCRSIQQHKPKRLYSYEIPSSTTQGLKQPFIPNVYNKTELQQLDKKIQAMNVYSDETRKYPNPRNQRGLIAYSEFRGMECNHEYAEAFMLKREINE